MKTITINGVALEATKEDLEKALKDFDKPVGSIDFSERSCSYGLYKNGEAQDYIGNKAKSFKENYSQLIYRIANAMGVLASKEEYIKLSTKYIIYYNSGLEAFEVLKFNSPVGTPINNEKNAMLIINLLNNSPLMKEFE